MKKASKKMPRITEPKTTVHSGVDCYYVGVVFDFTFIAKGPARATKRAAINAWNRQQRRAK